MKRVTLRGGPPIHPLVYERRVRHADRGTGDGDVVDVRTREGRPCGFGFFHRRSLIRVRMLSFDPDIYPDEEWLRARVRSAERLRREVLRLPERTDAWRVLHAEGDGVSGLVVDRYAGLASVALFSLGWFRRLPELLRVLADEASLPDAVVRADARSATQEGIDLPPPPPRPAIEVAEDGLVFRVDPCGGHKTGFFLDQRENRRALASLARGRTVFDGMTYTGAFALAAARGGAAAVRGMDLDEEAVALAGENARRNRLAAEFAHGDVFDALRALARAPEGERPEVLVVDPPKWAKDRGALGVALRRYRDLNRLALEAVRPGGLVLTHSCSGLVSEEAFLEVIRGAALDARREVRILSVAGAAPDHPVSATVPETRYLKSVLLGVGPPGSGPGSGAGRGGPEGAPGRRREESDLGEAGEDDPFPAEPPGWR